MHDIYCFAKAAFAAIQGNSLLSIYARYSWVIVELSVNVELAFIVTMQQQVKKACRPLIIVK